MFDKDKWEEILSSIKKNKLRTFLTAMGIFWGIFILIILLGSGKGIENGMLSAFNKQAINSLYIWTQPTTITYQGFPIGRNPQMTEEDIVSIKDQLGDQIETIAPRIEMGKYSFQRDVKEQEFEMRGELPDFLKVEPIDLISGRFINPRDVEERRKVIVIGERIREVLFGRKEEVIGQYIRCNDLEYRVVGVFKSMKNGGDAAEDEQTGFVPLTVAQQIDNMPGQIDWFVCTLKPNVNSSIAEKSMKSILRARHEIHPDDKQGIASFNMAKTFNRFKGLFSSINVFMWFVGIGTLFAGVVGVGNIMLIVVKERTKEFGIRKALGATPSSIVGMILLESVFITTLAGYLGLLLGTGGIAIMDVMFEKFNLQSKFFANPEVDLHVGIFALVILVVGGTLAGLVPAMQAARVDPVICLRND